MSSDWPQEQLSRLVTIKGGKRLPAGKSLQQEPNSHPYIRVRDVGRRDLPRTGLEYVPDDLFPPISRYIVQPSDVVLSIVGTIGALSIVDAKYNLASLTENCVKLHGLDQTDALYLFYYLSSPVGQQEIHRGTVGAVQPKLPIYNIEKIQVVWPSRSDRDRVANLLGALDDRITLLRETNATLEAIAQALFKSWFVDFDPVRAKQEGRAPEGMSDATAALFPNTFEESELGLVPRGWRVAPIGEVVETVGGGTPDTKDESYWQPAEFCWTTPKDLSAIHAPVLLDTERKLSAKGVAKISSGLLPSGTLLMSSRAPIGYLAIVQAPMAINQGYIAMPPGGTLPPLYLLFWCRQNMETIKNHANGSTFMEISKKAFRPLPAIIPPPEFVAEFSAVADALFGRVVENERQAQTLATLRDTLLPRLISGQLRLPEAEAMVAEVV